MSRKKTTVAGQPMPRHETTRKPLSELLPWSKNPRTISDRALAGLGESLKRFGLVQPIVWNKRTKRVVGGHQRIRALEAAGEKDAVVVVVDLPEDEEIALNLALNSPAISGEFTIDALPMIDALSLKMPELASALMLPDLREFLAKQFNVKPDEFEEDDVPPAPETPITKPGDLIFLGRHRLACGSCTDKSVVRHLMDDGLKPRLLLTDPPYGVELDMEWRDRAGLNTMGPAQSSYMKQQQRKDAKRANTSISNDTRADWSEAFELIPTLDVAYVWHASAYSPEVAMGLKRIGFEIKQQIIWRKPNLVLSRQHYHWQHEPCWYARKPGSAPFKGTRDQTTVWDAPSPKSIMSGSKEERVDHPTQKPVVLYTRPIQNHLDAGDCFYEPFGGIGTGIIAAEQTGTVCRSIELDPKFCDVIVARWEKLTGERAQRVPTHKRQ